MKQVINNLEKGDFPLAEWKEILSGNCFSHTLLESGDGFTSCDM